MTWQEAKKYISEYDRRLPYLDEVRKILKSRRNQPLVDGNVWVPFQNDEIENWVHIGNHPDYKLGKTYISKKKKLCCWKKSSAYDILDLNENNLEQKLILSYVLSLHKINQREHRNRHEDKDFSSYYVPWLEQRLDDIDQAILEKRRSYVDESMFETPRGNKNEY